jgi:hypothetical protein
MEEKYLMMGIPAPRIICIEMFLGIFPIEEFGR